MLEVRKKWGKRLSIHKSQLRGGYHPNIYLQRAWNLAGENNFEFIAIEICNTEELIEREQFWINDFLSYKDKYGYNLNPGAQRGCMSEETKRKISETKKGVPMNEEAKRKLSKTKTGVKLTPEHIEILRQSQIGRKHSPETIEKMKNSQKLVKHKPLSPEHKIKAIEALRRSTYKPNLKLRERDSKGRLLPFKS
jgi:group I intron endonuclease